LSPSSGERLRTTQRGKEIFQRGDRKKTIRDSIAKGAPLLRPLDRLERKSKEEGSDRPMRARGGKRIWTLKVDGALPRDVLGVEKRGGKIKGRVDKVRS